MKQSTFGPAGPQFRIRKRVYIHVTTRPVLGKDYMPFTHSVERWQV